MVEAERKWITERLEFPAGERKSQILQQVRTDSRKETVWEVKKS